MKTIQEKITELEIRTSSLEKKSGFQLPMEKATVEDIAEWIVVQPGVLNTVYLDVVEEIEGTLLHTYPQLLNVTHYVILEAFNKPSYVRVVFRMSESRFKATLSYFKKSGKVRITKSRLTANKPNKPRGVAVKTNSQELADLILDKGGLEMWGRFIKNYPITSLDQKKRYTDQLFQKMVKKLRNAENSYIPKRMSLSFKGEVKKILVENLPVSVRDGEFVYSK